jgi:hypothetical protein
MSKNKTFVLNPGRMPAPHIFRDYSLFKGYIVGVALLMAILGYYIFNSQPIVQSQIVLRVGVLFIYSIVWQILWSIIDKQSPFSWVRLWYYALVYLFVIPLSISIWLFVLAFIYATVLSRIVFVSLAQNLLSIVLIAYLFVVLSVSDFTTLVWESVSSAQFLVDTWGDSIFMWLPGIFVIIGIVLSYYRIMHWSIFVPSIIMIALLSIWNPVIYQSLVKQPMIFFIIFVMSDHHQSPKYIYGKWIYGLLYSITLIGYTIWLQPHWVLLLFASGIVQLLFPLLINRLIDRWRLARVVHSYQTVKVEE